LGSETLRSTLKLVSRHPFGRHVRHRGPSCNPAPVDAQLTVAEIVHEDEDDFGWNSQSTENGEGNTGPQLNNDFSSARSMATFWSCVRIAMAALLQCSEALRWHVEFDLLNRASEWKRTLVVGADRRDRRWPHNQGEGCRVRILVGTAHLPLEMITRCGAGQYLSNYHSGRRRAFHGLLSEFRADHDSAVHIRR